MPNREKVIHGLRCCRSIHVGATLEDSCNQCPYQKEKGRTCVADELFHDAIAILKVQEPVKPLKMEAEHVRKEPVVFSYKCPVCMCGLQRHWVVCPICGTGVKWE